MLLFEKTAQRRSNHIEDKAAVVNPEDSISHRTSVWIYRLRNRQGMKGENKRKNEEESELSESIPPASKLQKRELPHNSGLQKSSCRTTQVDLRQDLDKVKKTGIIPFSYRKIPEGYPANFIVAINKLPGDARPHQLDLRFNTDANEILKAFWTDMEPFHIGFLNLGGNDSLDLDLVEKMRQKFGSTRLDLGIAEFDQKKLQQLSEMGKLKKLTLNYAVFKCDPSTTLVKLINSGLEEFSAADSGIDENYLQRIAEGLRDNIQLKFLDLSHILLGEKGMKAIGRIVGKTTKMEMLALSDCDVDITLLESLSKAAKGKIRELHLSSNQRLFEGSLEVFSEITDKVGCEVLYLSNNALDGVKIKELAKTRRPEQIREVCLRDNARIDAAAAGEFARKWRLSGLDVSECVFTAADIKHLTASLHNHKLKFVNVSDSMAVNITEKKESLEILAKKAEKVFC